MIQMLQMIPRHWILPDTVGDTVTMPASDWSPVTILASDWSVCWHTRSPGPPGNMCHFLSVFCHYPPVGIDMSRCQSRGAANTNEAPAPRHQEETDKLEMGLLSWRTFWLFHLSWINWWGQEVIIHVNAQPFMNSNCHLLFSLPWGE